MLLGSTSNQTQVRAKSASQAGCIVDPNFSPKIPTAEEPSKNYRRRIYRVKRGAAIDMNTVKSNFRDHNSFLCNSCQKLLTVDFKLVIFMTLAPGKATC